MFVSLFSLLMYLSSFGVRCTDSLHGPVSRRIVRGFEVDIKAFPHAVFLYFNIQRPSTCGSSLITVQAVVTSAYCMRELIFTKGTISAFLGASVPMNSRVVRRIIAYEVHPKYDPNKGKFDLSVAKFEREVPLMHGIRKIPIYRKAVKHNEILFTAGWGKKWPNVVPDYSDMRSLEASKQKMTSVNECLNNSKIKPSRTFMCSIPVNGHHYRGDLGNGLVILKPFLALVGIVSFTVKDATLYANVMYQRDWIRRSVQKLYGKKPVDQGCC